LVYSVGFKRSCERVFSFAVLAFLSACVAPEPAPIVAAQQPAPTDSGTRVIQFESEDQRVAVAARCTVAGEDFSASFTTPAQIEVPFNNGDRAAIGSVVCSYGGREAAWTGIPGTQTRAIKAVFNSDGLFGDAALLFGPRPGQVQYFVRNGQFVTVSGSPAP